MNIINRIENFLYNRTSIISSIIFNFHYLPFKQAIKLPILLHNPIFHRLRKGRCSIFSLKGKIIIDCDNVTQGMIRLGYILTTSHHDQGFIWANEGTVVFRGKTKISQSCSIRNAGVLEFGDDVLINSNSKIICFYHISMGNSVRFSWDSLVCDTNFHPMKKVVTGEKIKPYAEVIIGNNVWIGQKCLILSGTKLDDGCIISGGTIVTKRLKTEPMSIVVGSQAAVVSSGKYYRDFKDDGCTYEKYEL